MTVIRTLHQSLDHLASISLLYPLATDKPRLWTILKLISFHQMCVYFVMLRWNFFHQSLYFLLAVSHFYLTKRNNIGATAIKVSFYPRVGTTECMEMDIITKSYFQGNIILLLLLTLMIGFFFASQQACHCSCCHGNKIYLRLNVVNRISTHACMYL